MEESGKIIVESNDEMEIWASVEAVIDKYGNLVLTLEYQDDSNHGRNNRTYAVIDGDELPLMERLLCVQRADIPGVLYDRFGDTSNRTVPSEVRKMFQDILEFLLDCGVRYRLKEERGGWRV